MGDPGQEALKTLSSHLMSPMQSTSVELGESLERSFSLTLQRELVGRRFSFLSAVSSVRNGTLPALSDAGLTLGGGIAAFFTANPELFIAGKVMGKVASSALKKRFKRPAIDYDHMRLSWVEDFSDALAEDFVKTYAPILKNLNTQKKEDLIFFTVRSIVDAIDERFRRSPGQLVTYEEGISDMKTRYYHEGHVVPSREIVMRALGTLKSSKKIPMFSSNAGSLLVGAPFKVGSDLYRLPTREVQDRGIEEEHLKGIIWSNPLDHKQKGQYAGAYRLGSEADIERYHLERVAKAA